MIYEGDLKRIIKERWGARARTYDISPGHGVHSDQEKQAWMRILSKALDDKKKQKVLDVGTGTGVLALLLAEMNHEVTAIDLSDKMLNKAGQKAEISNLKIEFQLGDAESPPFENESYDAIVNRHLIWTLPNPEKAISAWKNILKPGGRLIIIDGDFGKMEKTLFQEIWRYMAMPLILLTELRYPKMSDKTIDEYLPMRKKKRPEADVEMLDSQGFKTSVAKVRLPRKYTMLSYLKYGYSKYSEYQFVIKAVKAA